jgi:hypothetical protein
LRVRVQLPLFSLGDNNKKMPLQCRDIYSFRFLCCTASNTSLPQLRYQGTNDCLLQFSFQKSLSHWTVHIWWLHSGRAIASLF